MSMYEKTSQAFALSLAEKPPTFTSTPYHGRNMTTRSTRPLPPAIISPRLSRDISTDFPPQIALAESAVSDSAGSAPN